MILLAIMGIAAILAFKKKGGSGDNFGSNVFRVGALYTLITVGWRLFLSVGAIAFVAWLGWYTDSGKEAYKLLALVGMGPGYDRDASGVLIDPFMPFVRNVFKIVIVIAVFIWFLVRRSKRGNA